MALAVGLTDGLGAVELVATLWSWLSGADALGVDWASGLGSEDAFERLGLAEPFEPLDLVGADSGSLDLADASSFFDGFGVAFSFDGSGLSFAFGCASFSSFGDVASA